jgi:hypothetical protein
MGPLVDDLVKDLKALVGKTYFVSMGVKKKPSDQFRVVRRNLGSGFKTDVPGRLLHPRK